MEKTFLAGNGNAKPETGDQRPETGNRRLPGVAEIKTGRGAKSRMLGMGISIRRLLMMAAVMMALTAFTACVEDENGGSEDNNGGGGNKPQAGTYSAEKDGVKYVLTISKGSNSQGSSQKGNNFELTASSKKSAGSIIDDEDDILTLQPSNSDKTFFVTVHDKSITSIYEPVTWSDGTKSKMPGLFPGNFSYVPDPNLKANNRLRYGAIVKKTSSGIVERYVWDEANQIEATTSPEGIYHSGCSGGKFYIWFSDLKTYFTCSDAVCYPFQDRHFWDIENHQNDKRLPDREIAGMTCSVYESVPGNIIAHYRHYTFLLSDGKNSTEVISFTEVVDDYAPPSGYVLDEQNDIYCSD